MVVQSDLINKTLESLGAEVSIEEQGDATNELKVQFISESEFNTFVD